MNEKIVIGHKNPDTDSAVSAFVWSRILNKKGIPALPALANKPNKEVFFVFEKAGVDLPKIIDLKGKEVFLVDHNEKSQMADGIEKVIGVIDHHKVSFSTDEPIFFRSEVIGSTSSLVRKITIEQNIELEEDEAILLLCGIISDTLNFNSATTTKQDIEFAKELSDLLDEDIDALATAMFEAKSDFSDMSIDEIIKADYKDFELGNKKVGIAVSEVVTFSFFDKNKDEIIIKLKDIKNEKKLDYLFFGVINILEKNTLLFYASEIEAKLAKEAFKVRGVGNPEVLEGATSRKKEIIPPLSKLLENK